jgi:hypothetical protein
MSSPSHPDASDTNQPAWSFASYTVADGPCGNGGSKLLIFDRRAAHRHPKPPESSDSEGGGLIALILGRSRPRFRPPLHSWPGLHGSSEANVTSVLVRNGRPVDDVFEIDPSGSTREAAGSAAGSNLVLASAFNL